MLFVGAFILVVIPAVVVVGLFGLTTPQPSSAGHGLSSSSSRRHSACSCFLDHYYQGKCRKSISIFSDVWVEHPIMKKMAESAIGHMP